MFNFNKGKIMRLLSVLFALLMSFEAFALINQDGSSSFDATGTVKDREQIFIRVKNGSSSSAAVGTAMSVSTSADDGVTHTISTGEGDEAVSCIVSGSAIAAGATGKCQVYGYHSAVLFDSFTGTYATAGESAYVSGNRDGYVHGYPEASVATKAKRVGVFLDAATATGSVEVFLNLL